MKEEDRQRMMDECYECVHRRSVPGNAHIECANRDPLMTGNKHGKKNGWFFYPLLFDPVWKTKLCSNFEEKVNHAVGNAVSREKSD